MKRSQLALLLLPLVVACGAHDSSDAVAVAAKVEELAIPAPYGSPDAKTSAWDGSYIDLMAADTWATCSFLQGRDVPINHKLVAPGDEYLDRLLTRMKQVSAQWLAKQTTPSPYAQQQWIDFRNDLAYNRNRSTGAGESAGLKRRDLTRYTIALTDPNYTGAQTQASESVALAAMNACIAQGVRSLSLGGDTMLLSEPEQIQALEVVRERAQIAMLQYAAIINAIAAPSGATATVPATTYQQIAFLQRWAQVAPERAQSFAAWVGDFAAVIQLHLTATRELGELFARSAAAHSPRGGRAATAADEEWGPGAWRQRLLALLYGGDPLATESDNSTPWRDMVGRTAPGVALDTSVRPADPWPTRVELPYFVVDARDPHVQQLLALARRADVSRLANLADGSVDVEKSAEQLYRALEARLRSDQCVSRADTTCSTVPIDAVPPWASGGSPTPIDSYLLFSSFGITRDHARTAVQLLDQYAPTSGISPIHVVGALQTTSDATGSWRYVPRASIDAPRTLDEMTPLFERYAPYRIPSSVDPNVERSHFETTSSNVTYRIGDDQGLAAGGLYAESMRVFGALPALSLVRDVLDRALASTAAPAELKTALGTVGSPLRATVDAAIGARLTRVTPLESVKAYDWANSGVAGGRVATERLQTVKVVRTPAIVVTAGWAIDVDVAGDDAFFAPGSTVDLVAVKNDATAYALALSTQARRFDGKGFADLAAAATSVTAPMTIQSGRAHAEIYLIPENLSTAPPPAWTFVARKTSGGVVKYRPLTGAVPLYAWQFNRVVTGRTGELAPIYGFAFGRDGQLGSMATRAWTLYPANPSRPEYDGFGFPYGFTPSADATAFGSQPGDTVMSYFLRNAKQAAAEATDAVRTAINSSLAQAQATLDEQAAQARSSLVIQQEAQHLCGAAMQPGSPSCAPPVHTVDLPVTWTPLPSAWGGVSDPGSYCDANMATETDQVRHLDCLARRRILGATRGAPLADPVAVEITASAPPSFSPYAGGAIQSVLVDEWSAVRRVQNAALAIENAKKATAQRMAAGQATLGQLQAALDAAKTQLTGLQGEQALVAQRLKDTMASAKAQCDAVLLEMGKQNRSETSVEGMLSELDWAANTWSLRNSAFTHGKVDTGDFDRQAQLANLVASCEQSRAALDEAQLQATQFGVMQLVTQKQADAAKWTLEAARGNTLAEAIDGVGAVLRLAGELDTAVADVAKTAAQLAQLKQDAQLSVARQQLEAALATQGAQLSLGLYRQYSQYDWWRARALLDGARRYAVMARRAIETAYVVDLGTLTSAEPFVAAPAWWGADAYRYDLSMPAAVGLSTGQGGGGQYPNQVLDYVGNLERFVQGFAVQRPMTSAVDSQVLAIPGPGARIVVGGQVVPDPGRATWSVLCPAASGCAPSSGAAWCQVSTAVPVAQTCSIAASAGGTPTYAAPTKARVSFYLDPWGRAVGHDTLPLLDGRVNARWGRLAVNLVGNGIRDCSREQNPSDCQANAYLPYDLRHLGPSLAVGATRDWMSLDVPEAQIDAGKAATLGEFLDVLQNAWGKPFVEAIARTELIGRPLNGTYTLELDGGPSVSFDQVETVQILCNQTYFALQP